MLSDVKVRRFGLSSFVEALVNIQPVPLCCAPYKIPVQEYGSSWSFLFFFFIPHLSIQLFRVLFSQEQSLHYLLPAFRNFEHVLTL
jgi:hypothetical protein